MVVQHRLSPSSQAPVPYSPELSWNLITLSGLSFWSLAPDASISNNSCGGSPLPSTTQQHGNGIYPPFGQGDTKANIYNPQLGDFPEHHPAPSTSDKTSVQRHRYSPQDDFPRPQTRAKVPDNQFAVEMDATANRAPRAHFPRFDIHTHQSQDLMNCSHTITDIKADLSDHERAMTAEAHIPMMPLRPKPLSDECSCSPTCSTSGATRLNTMPQEANEASRRYNKGEHLASAPATPSQLFMTPYRSTSVDEMAEKPYQCSLCPRSFSQSQGLARHGKDKHLPDNQCEVCVEFTWPQGRRYLYRKHLRKEHPGFESPSVSVFPMIRRRRRVKLKGQHICENPIAPRTC